MILVDVLHCKLGLSWGLGKPTAIGTVGYEIEMDIGSQGSSDMDMFLVSLVISS
mgnify:CR=1 FL=1